MRLLTELDAMISSKLLPLLERHGATALCGGESNNHAFRDYVFANIHLRISNDRGLLDIEIGPAGESDLRSVSFYRDLLNPPDLGHWNLSIEEQCDFLEQHWMVLNERLSRERARKTIDEVDANVRRRRRSLQCGQRDKAQQSRSTTKRGRFDDWDQFPGFRSGSLCSQWR